MNMDGLGRKLLDQMVDKGIVEDPADLYFLDKEALAKMDRMGDKLAENLLDAIAKSKTPDLANLIYGLGIRNVGYHLAGVLAKTFKSIDKLAEQGIQELTEVHEVGPIVAQSLHNYFQNPKNLEILDKLKRGGVEFPVEETRAGEEPLAGKTFALTGGLDTLTRDEARSLIQEQGGRVSSSVSKKTDFVVVGKDAGSKLDKARKLGVEILNEDDFKKMVGR
jgi:DNA ligase (NAD+)